MNPYTIDLYEIIYDIVSQVPEGKVTTYGAVAKALGDIRAARAVGEALSMNPRPIVVPCHRVVMSDGSLGGFTHPNGLSEKIKLLAAEGVEIIGGKVNLKKHFFDDFNVEVKPLELFRKYQEELSRKAIIEDHAFENVVGIDVSYDGRIGVVAAVVFEGKEPSFVRFYAGKVNVPYIPTYLAFREFPLIKNVLKSISDPLLFLDGHGILHPRKCGYATHVGVEVDKPSIGIAKKILVGQYNFDELKKASYASVFVENEKRGYALNKKHKKPIFVSPGHKITVERSKEITLEYRKYKLPEPTRLAHIYSKKGLIMYKEKTLKEDVVVEVPI